MNVKALSLIASVLALAACAAPEASRPHHGHMKRMPDQVRTAPVVQSFACENGLSVRVRHLNNQQIELRLDDKRAVLSSAVAASGERYTASNGLFGRGAEWHQKGGEAFFGFTDPYGNQVETSCRVR